MEIPVSGAESRIFRAQEKMLQEGFPSLEETESALWFWALGFQGKVWFERTWQISILKVESFNLALQIGII